MARFFRIERAGHSLADRAEAAMPRADVAAEHERRGAIRPALKNVWATGFLANSVQVQALDQLQYVVLVRRVAQTNLQPLWLWLTGRRVVADYSEFARQNWVPLG